MKTKIIRTNNEKIHYLDFSNLKNVKDIENVISEASKIIQTQTESSVLSLSNLEGMHFNNDIKEAFIAFVHNNKPFIKASAIIGLNGIAKIAFNGIVRVSGRNLKAFKTKDEAISYLASLN